LLTVLVSHEDWQPKAAPRNSNVKHDIAIIYSITVIHGTAAVSKVLVLADQQLY
jgi:hypothetical protein